MTSAAASSMRRSGAGGRRPVTSGSQRSGACPHASASLRQRARSSSVGVSASIFGVRVR